MIQRVIISRTDSIGDVMLTLPMCGLLKKYFPQCEIIFLGRSYTADVVKCCKHVDHFEDWDLWRTSTPNVQVEALAKWNAKAIIHVFPRKEILWLAKRAKIPIRVATGRRLQTIAKCNKLVFFSRKKSQLHEAQLNMKLLRPLGIVEIPALDDVKLFYGFERIPQLPQGLQSLIDRNKKNIILHPKSKGSAAEWGLTNFAGLIRLLPEKEFKIFVTGTTAEGNLIKSDGALATLPVEDLTGKMTLSELVAFINHCDALVAASTGPLHIAAALGKNAIGLFTPKRPMHPERWAPLGTNAKVITASSHPAKGSYLDINASVVAKLI